MIWYKAYVFDICKADYLKVVKITSKKICIEKKNHLHKLYKNRQINSHFSSPQSTVYVIKML